MGSRCAHLSQSGAAPATVGENPLFQSTEPLEGSGREKAEVVSTMDSQARRPACNDIDTLAFGGIRGCDIFSQFANRTPPSPRLLPRVARAERRRKLICIVIPSLLLCLQVLCA